MTMKTLLLAGAAAATFAAAPALAQSQAPSTPDFVNKAAVSDMFEVQSSEIARQKGDADNKRFARRMIHDHTRTTDQLKALVASGKVQAQLPQGLDSDHQQKLDQLKSASGDDFNKQYDDMQKQGHEDAVTLFQSYAEGGDNPSLKRWAAKTLPHLRDHLNMANNLK